MKIKSLSICFLIAVICLSACNKEDSSETFRFGFEEIFQRGKINLANDNSLQFNIIEINDSRCPSDVICIWQGEAIIKINIEKPHSGLVELSTYDNLIDTIGAFSFQLIDVSPYPISTQSLEQDDYNVVLKIEKL